MKHNCSFAAFAAPFSHRFFATGLGAMVLVFALGAHAQPIAVPNFSFESPTPPPGFPATPQVDNWQKSSQPVWYDPGTFGGLEWSQLSGVFPNTDPSQPDHIDNVEGDQAAYLFTLSTVGLSQELTASYQPGLSYDLTIGILGTGGIVEGDTFSFGLYYLDGGNPVSIASEQVVFNTTDFPNANHLVDFSLSLPTVQAGDAWAGQNIGIELTSLIGTGSGFWDVDNVRLQAIPEPSSIALLTLGLGAGLVVVRRKRRGIR